SVPSRPHQARLLAFIRFPHPSLRTRLSWLCNGLRSGHARRPQHLLDGRFTTPHLGYPDLVHGAHAAAACSSLQIAIRCRGSDETLKFAVDEEELGNRGAPCEARLAAIGAALGLLDEGLADAPYGRIRLGDLPPPIVGVIMSYRATAAEATNKTL